MPHRKIEMAARMAGADIFPTVIVFVACQYMMQHAAAVAAQPPKVPAIRASVEK